MSDNVLKDKCHVIIIEPVIRQVLESLKSEYRLMAKSQHTNIIERNDRVIYMNIDYSEYFYIYDDKGRKIYQDIDGLERVIKYFDDGSRIAYRVLDAE